ncbi:MAG: electron transport complex subunit RsxC [Clostridia bacterium]|nr:electron transport complex subunit RsxC [Clostridia bacterium]
MTFHLKGVKLSHKKATAGTSAVRMPSPKTVLIPTVMHIGAPAKLEVAVGTEVKVGTLIASASSRISSPIYSSVSGKVTKITDYLLASGTTVPAVLIESDGLMTPEEVTPPTVNSREDFIAAVRDSGIVGLGGAGFPTYVKLDVPPEKIEHVIINGAECEPYITSDTYTMTERVEDMKAGLLALQKHLGVSSIVIGVESHNSAAVDSMQLLAAAIPGVSVKVLPSKYPQGGEKVLIYHTVGRVVPIGELPISVGCVVLNCTTVAAIGEYLKTGMPLVERCVTVDGAAVKNPQNVIAPIGTLISDLIDFAGGFNFDPAKVLYGGPMMGVSLPNMNFPVVKNTNAVLALSDKEIRYPKVTACIRCGACTNTCPFGLAPAAIAKAYDKKDVEELEKLRVVACMECGCCSFTCPANRPLVQTNKLAKEYLKKEAKKNG